MERLPQRRGSITLRLGALSLFLVAWQILGLILGSLFLPTPLGVAFAALELIGSGIVLQAAFNSLSILAVGYVLAIVVAIPLGLLMGGFKRVGETLDVYVNAFNSTPRIALLPLIIVWFGLGSPAKVFIVFLSALFPIIINTYSGVSNVGEDLLETAKAFGSKDRQTFRKIMFPASLPTIITGLRLGAARGVLGILMAEFFTAASGLGGLIVTYGNTFQMEKFFVPVLILVAIGTSISELLKSLERKLAPWKTTEVRI
ncbi:MAG: ABC transporter permease [Thaumarchaeota archaeon]|nr:ABC transporter permease [Nitrososphaerota archaeon]